MHPAQSRTPSWVAPVVAVVVGLVLGYLTRVGQQHLPETISSLANSSAPWTLVAFALSLPARPRAAAVASAVLALLALIVGYSVSAVSAGYAVSTTFLVFWGACAVVVGPVVALLGWWARHDPGTGRTLTVAALCGLLGGEGAYGLTVVRSSTSPVYWSLELAVAAVGLLALGVVRRSPRQAGLAVLGTLVVAAAFLVLYRLAGGLV